MTKHVESNTKENELKDLIAEVLKRKMQPEDQYEIAAILESMGWNDARVAEKFGVEDIFEIAEDIWGAIQDKILFTPMLPTEKSGFISHSIDTLRNFLRGLIFALPMAISVFSMLTLRFSLWSYENLSLELATSIAIATILSFMVVGGFTQSIARRGFFYITQDYYNMARKITFYFIKIGYILCASIAALGLILNSFLEVFPFRMMIIIILYFFFLTAIWLSVTVMYILRKEIVFTGLLVAGILIVYGLYKAFISFNITNSETTAVIIAQIIALILVSVSGILLVIYFFVVAERKMEKGIAPSLPRMSITLYSVLPYFIYGFLYFTFIYADRVVAWSTNDTGYMPYLIWFRGSYELGMDFALLMLMVPMGFIEVVVGKLMRELEVSQKEFSGFDTSELGKKFMRIYNGRVITVFIFSIISAVSVFLLIRFIDRLELESLRSDLLATTTTVFVFIVALAGYTIISIGLMNSIILFSLSQPEMVNRAILPAFLTNVIVGFLLSRWMSAWPGLYNSYLEVEGYSFAVFGLLAGSIVFVILTYKSVRKVLTNLDYYIYASS